MGRPATLKVEILADAKGVDRGVAQAEGRFSRMGGRLGKVGKLAGTGLLAVGAAAGAMAVASVKAASDLEQNMGAVETVFGKSADAVKRYADTAATAVGLSKAEYTGLAASVGTSMQNMGQSQAQAAKTSDALIGRAADLAATFGGTTKEATEALGSAFRGEFDPVERLGISLRASDISAELAARGQAHLTGQALKNAQGQATLDLIMRQTTKSTGAFGRESDTLAHQQQVLSARFDNVKAAIGARLIPVLVRLAQWAQDRLLPALSRLGAFVMQRVVPVFRSYLTPIIDGVRSAIARVTASTAGSSSQFAKLRPVLTAVGKAIQVAAPIIGTVLGHAFEVAGAAIGGIVTALGGLIGFVDSVWRRFDDLGRKVGDVIGGIRGAAETVGGVMSHLPGFNLDVTRARPHLVGPVGGMGLGPQLGLLTASAGSTPLLGLAATSAGTRPAAGPVTVNMPVTVTGALDPVAVARQLQAILRDGAVRLGRAATYAPGRA